ncbi:2224_t:CDS:1, partial [Rhizophagus irregularis]
NLPPQRQPERSFWEKLYDMTVYLKDKFMENIIKPIIERFNRPL